MKTLIVNGSPRKRGNTSRLIEEFERHLDGEIYSYNTYRDKLSPCTDCRYCWKKEGCSIKDDMQEVYRLANEVDVVLFASPLNYSELNGTFLGFASRFQTFYAAKYIRKDPTFTLKKKIGLLFLVGGGDTKVPDIATKTGKIILRSINAPLYQTVASLNTDSVPVEQDTVAMEAVKRIALELNKRF